MNNCTDEFFIDKDDLMWNAPDGQEIKLAQKFCGEFDFEDVLFLNEIHGTSCVTLEVIKRAEKFVKCL